MSNSVGDREQALDNVLSEKKAKDKHWKATKENIVRSILENYQAMHKIQEFLNYLINIKIEGTRLIKIAKVHKAVDGF